jgi:hypothetical protein
MLIYVLQGILDKSDDAPKAKECPLDKNELGKVFHFHETRNVLLQTE